jgi:acyl-CoA synthetase (AMP-forming)/AMP-acid ligase II
MAIVMNGGVYCPLSPRDPERRLHSLLQETNSRVVLVHYPTKTKFNDDIIIMDIDSLLINRYVANDVNVSELSNVKVTPDSIAYVIFTSGSTGIPKAVSTLAHDLITY